MENTKKAVAEFERRLSAEVRRQKKFNKIEKKDFRRGELLENYMARMLYE